MFGDRLRQARKTCGYTQESLAAAIGVKKSTVCGYESGSSEPDMDKIVKIMAVLNVDANYLYQDEMEATAAPAMSADAIEFALEYDMLPDKAQKILKKMLDILKEYV